MQVNDTVVFHPGVDPTIPHDDKGVLATVVAVHDDGTVDIKGEIESFLRTRVPAIAAGAESIEAHIEAEVVKVAEDLVAEAKRVGDELAAAAENPPGWFTEELHKVEGFFGKAPVAATQEPQNSGPAPAAATSDEVKP